MRTPTKRKSDDSVETPKHQDGFVESYRNPAFVGSITFGLEFSALGEKFERQVRVNFQRTPEWPYWDVNCHKERIGYELTVTETDVYALPEIGTKAERRPSWERVDLLVPGVITRALIDRIDQLIDDECRRLDQIRRGKEECA